MTSFTSRTTGGWLLLVGSLGSLALISLLLFFIGLFQNISSLRFMGALNDTLNALTGIASAVLASRLHTTLRRLAPRVSLVLLISVWIGAIAIAFGSWLIVTGRSNVELSSYYFFFGNGLIGIWLWLLNRTARQQTQTIWPRNLTGWGLNTSAFMMVGLLGLYGIILGLDGSDYSPLIVVTGISFFGIGIFYPIWSLRLGRWILSKQDDSVLADQVLRGP